MTAIAHPKKLKPKKLAFTGPTLKMFEFATVDFETEAIARRPEYPPVPVSYSLKLPGEKKFTFYAWGHPEGNNTTKEKEQRRLRDLWRSKTPLLFQHGKFDIDVGEVHMDLPRLPWERYHDTEYLLFLQDPHARSLSLKESAHRILKIKPEERDTLREWILKNVPGARKRPSEWGAYISRAPAQLVAPYANGDGIRTEKLFVKLLPDISKRNMMAAYDRERHLMPILLETERRGIRVNLGHPPNLKRELKLDGTLENDYIVYQQALAFADSWLRKKLKCPDLNFNADKDLGDALANAGIVTDWTWTKGGHGRAPQRSVSKKNLTLDKFNNQKVAAVLGYRNRLTTCISMFMEPWIAMARSSGGCIFTNWNQVRQSHGNDNLVGARTGRLSSNPNLQNISKDFEDKDDGYKNPTFLPQLPPLPLMRKYLLPDPGEVWGHRDFNQQELRLLAHFEDGSLAQHYRDDPRFDVHNTMQEGVKRIAMIVLTRSGTKILNFSDIYGKGESNLAVSLGVDLGTIKQIKEAKNQLMPDVKALTDGVKLRGTRGEPIRTWGGREYFMEEAKYVVKYNRVMDFAYKLLNYLIQGSAADVTKEAVIRYAEHPKRRARFMLTVHDELNSSMPKLYLKPEMKVLRECMEDIPGIDVPMLSDGKVGNNWGTLKKFED